jgi:hypothetical protein
MDIHSCAGSPIVPCVLRTRLHGIVNDENFAAGAALSALAKREVVAVTIVHREGIRMGVRVELSHNRLTFHMRTIKFGTYQHAVRLIRSKLHSHFGAKER